MTPLFLWRLFFYLKKFLTSTINYKMIPCGREMQEMLNQNLKFLLWRGLKKSTLNNLIFVLFLPLLHHVFFYVLSIQNGVIVFHHKIVFITKIRTHLCFKQAQPEYKLSANKANKVIKLVLKCQANRPYTLPGQDFLF